MQSSLAIIRFWHPQPGLRRSDIGGNWFLSVMQQAAVSVARTVAKASLKNAIGMFFDARRAESSVCALEMLALINQFSMIWSWLSFK